MKVELKLPNSVIETRMEGIHYPTQSGGDIVAMDDLIQILNAGIIGKNIDDESNGSVKLRISVGYTMEVKSEGQRFSIKFPKEMLTTTSAELIGYGPCVNCKDKQCALCQEKIPVAMREFKERHDGARTMTSVSSQRVRG